MDKKDREKSILKMVYNNDRIDEIIDCENPDFKVRNNHQQAFFGVEVTELYYSESNARLRNIPNYLDNLFRCISLPYHLNPPFLLVSFF